jgi:hypothetical protein
MDMLVYDDLSLKNTERYYMRCLDCDRRLPYDGSRSHIPRGEKKEIDFSPPNLPEWRESR